MPWARVGTDVNHTTETDYNSNRPGWSRCIQPAPATGQSRPTTYYHYDANGNLDGVTDARGAAPGNLSSSRLTTRPTRRNTSTTSPTARSRKSCPTPTAAATRSYTQYFYDDDGNLYASDAGHQRPELIRHTAYTTQYVTITSAARSRRSSPTRPRQQPDRPELPEDHLRLRPKRQPRLDDRPERQHDPLRLQPGRPADPE